MYRRKFYQSTNGVTSVCGETHKTLCLNSKGGRNGIEGLQPSLKDRIYDTNGIATACTTSPFFMPNYLVDVNFLKPRVD